MRNIPCLLVVLGALVLSGCDTGPKGSIGFTLPDGDVERGKATYVKFGCNACHVTEQIPQLESGEPAAISVLLGGETTRIKSYGELVTSIINPSHRVSRRKSGDLADASGASKMITYNDVMTVSQLIDLVAFVQSNYTLTPYKNTPYPVYWIPEPSQKK
jgi:sulfur-oxidizing protein SoxX